MSCVYSKFKIKKLEVPMSKKYANLFSPLQVGKRLLKSHITATPSAPTAIQGSENYPIEALIQHYANKARMGAAIVTCSGSKWPLDNNEEFQKLIQDFRFDYTDRLNSHYVSQLTECIHAFDSLATMLLIPANDHEYDFGEGFLTDAIPGMKRSIGIMTPNEGLYAIAENMATEAKLLRDLGFDGVYLHMAYGVTFMGRSLSPLTNNRTDEFGGSFENRLRFPLMICEKIKKACGQNFLIEVAITGEERDFYTYELVPGGWTIEDTCKFAQVAGNLIDILHVRGWSVDRQHCMGFTSERTPYLYLAEAVKKVNPQLKVLTVSGYSDPESMEDIIASGKADLIGMARGLISCPEFSVLCQTGHEDDIVPCIRCNKCLRTSANEPFTSRCSVNPIFGMEHRYQEFITPPSGEKKVAVIGGGPAGMKAAIECSKRGYSVSLYEKSGKLGGQLNIADFMTFKWPLKEFKDYLVHQVGKRSINVYMNTEVTPAEIDEARFDAVICAMGSKPVMPPIPGIEKGNVMSAIEVFGHEAELPEKIVIIGGGENGMETGMYLAQKGHDVTVLEMTDKLMPEASPVHYRTMAEAYWQKIEKFHTFVNAKVTMIKDDSVVYVDAEAIEHSVPAEAVVLAAGGYSLHEEAMKYAKCHGRFFVIGDNYKTANVMELMRSAYFTANQI